MSMKIIDLNLYHVWEKYPHWWKFKKMIHSQIQDIDIIHLYGDGIPHQIFNKLLKSINKDIVFILDDNKWIDVKNFHQFYLIIHSSFKLSYQNLKALAFHPNCQEIFIDYSSIKPKEIWFNKPIAPMLSNIYQNKLNYSWRHLDKIKVLYEKQLNIFNNILKIDQKVDALNHIVDKKKFVLENQFIKKKQKYNLLMGMMGDTLLHDTYKSIMKKNLRNMNNEICLKCSNMHNCLEQLLGIFMQDQCVNWSIGIKQGIIKINSTNS